MACAHFFYKFKHFNYEELVCLYLYNKFSDLCFCDWAISSFTYPIVLFRYNWAMAYFIHRYIIIFPE